MARAPKYAKQPLTIRPGAWVRFVSERYARIQGTVGQVVSASYDDLNVEHEGGRAQAAAVRYSDVALLTPEEAAPYIAARAARIERDERVQANRLPDVSGRSHFARRRR